LLKSILVGAILISPSRKPAASRRFWTGITVNPSTTAASAAFSAGTRTPAFPSARARQAMGKTPLTGRIAPSRANSPTITKFSSWSVTNCSVAPRMPTAIGKSKLGPSFLTSAGARLIVVRPIGNLKPELVRAVLTRSRDSLTAASGKPTMTMTVSPQPAFTSTSTKYASMPMTAAEQTLANMATFMIERSKNINMVFRQSTTQMRHTHRTRGRLSGLTQSGGQDPFSARSGKFIGIALIQL